MFSCYIDYKQSGKRKSKFKYTDTPDSQTGNVINILCLDRSNSEVYNVNVTRLNLTHLNTNIFHYAHSFFSIFKSNQPLSLTDKKLKKDRRFKVAAMNVVLRMVWNHHVDERK